VSVTAKNDCTGPGIGSPFRGRAYGALRGWLPASLAAAVGACVLGLPAPTGWAEVARPASRVGPIAAGAPRESTVYLKVSLDTMEDFRWSFRYSQATGGTCTEVQIGAGNAEQALHWKGNFEFRYSGPDHSSWSEVSEAPLTATYLQDGSYSDRFSSTSCGKSLSSPQTDCGKVIRGTGAGSIGYNNLNGFVASWPDITWQRTTVRCPLGPTPTSEPEELTTLADTNLGFLVDEPVPAARLLALALGGSLTSQGKREITGKAVPSLGCLGLRGCQAAADFSWSLKVQRYR
jgi:hypothetical protein